MFDLNVFTPELDYVDYEPDVKQRAAAEEPINLECKAPEFPDGTPFGLKNLAYAKDLGRAGYVVYRRDISPDAGGFQDVWDFNAKRWRPKDEVAETDLSHIPMFFKEGESHPWQGVFVAAGEQDEAGKCPYLYDCEQFEYSFGVLFAGQQSEGDQLFTGLSQETEAIHFVSSIEMFQAGLLLGKDDPRWRHERPGGRYENAKTATGITLFLRGESLDLIGSVQIKRDNGKAVLELARWDPLHANRPIATVQIGNEISIELSVGEPSDEERTKILLSEAGDVTVDAAAGLTLRSKGLELTDDGSGNVNLNCTNQLTISAPKVIIETSDDTDKGLHTGRIRYEPSNSGGMGIGYKRWLRW